MAFDLDVAKRLGEIEVALQLDAGDGVTVLFGPSGVGKTSVLNMVAGLLRPDRGHIRVAGVTLFDAATDLPPERRRAGYVFQEPRLFPHLRVAANLRYAGARETMIDAVAHLLDIAHLMDRWPRTLSGGEAKRVAIGRALLRDPAFLLLDEPTASLDRARADEVERAVLAVRDELGLPILMVTHDRAEADRLATRIVEMVR
ncbi:ATP-binding cassette domain-containing protein [Sphingomonas sp.]|jgi:molybdate transport system ATP-binding protein|uniref:ATP-binding cassette domain-containing protein n=1 Tax=Sphingomonas sp. TaxID=28214 RepID=UPI002E33ED7F|nr:ATP-binding cassette domain-containing protein [Sphingomonas sp.]HEX4693158.1 ATP-binding cassette domain-containing protein [Sphingomonas sp.]